MQSGNRGQSTPANQYGVLELMAYKAYRNPELDIRYWRTSTGYEVDVIVGQMDVAIEIKSSSRVHSGLMRSLRSLNEEFTVREAVVVCMESEPRRTEDGIHILPWRYFVDMLWSGAFGI